jgi:hypothetical protein
MRPALLTPLTPCFLCCCLPLQKEWGHTLAALGSARQQEAALHLRVAATLFLQHHMPARGSGTQPQAGRQAGSQRYTTLDGQSPLDGRSSLEVGGLYRVAVAL